MISNKTPKEKAMRNRAIVGLLGKMIVGTTLLYFGLVTTNVQGQNVNCPAPILVNDTIIESEFDAYMFGWSVSLSDNGEVLVVGSPYHQVLDKDSAGRIIVYRRGMVRFIPTLIITGTQAGQMLGYSVSISGDGKWLAVGSPYYDNGGNKDAGLVLLYRWNGLTWILLDSIEGHQPGQELGYSVSISRYGGRVAIGAPGFDIGDSVDAGKTQVYVWSGVSWILESEMNGTYQNERLGVSLSLERDEDILAIASKKQIMVYERVTSLWNNQTTLSIPGGYSHRGLQVKFNMWGNVLAVGAPGYDLPNKPNIGAVFLFDYANNNLVMADSIIGWQQGQQLGHSIAINGQGNRLIIGSPKYDTSDSVDAGIIYVYHKQGNNWQDIDSLIGSQHEGNRGFAVSISRNGDHFVWSSPFYDGKATQYIKRRFNCGRLIAYEWDGTKWDGADTMEGIRLTAWFCFRPIMTMDNEMLVFSANTYGTKKSQYYDVTGALVTYVKQNNRWVLQNILMPDEQNSGRFGFRTLFSKDDSLLFVGHPRSFTNEPGAIYIYRWDNYNWVLVDSLRGFQGGDGFGGYFLLLDNDSTLVVSASLSDVGDSINAGKVFIYRRAGNSWTLVDSILGQRQEEHLGVLLSASKDGNTLLIFPTYYNVTNTNIRGKVLTYKRSGNSWTLQDSIISLQNTYVRSVMTSVNNENYVIIGQNYDAPGGLTRAGRILIYKEIGGTWTIVDSFVGRQAWDYCNRPYISDDGTILAVNCPGRNINGEPNVGIAYILYFNGNTWELKDSLIGLHPYWAAFSTSFSKDNSYLILSSIWHNWYNKKSVINGRGPSSGGIQIIKLVPNAQSHVSRVSCDSFISPTGNVWYSSGIYYDTLQSNNGCDSIIEFNISILNSVFSSVRYSGCDSIILPNGNVIYASGIYYDTLTSSHGCDSIIGYNVHLFHSPPPVTLTIASCDSFISPSGKVWNTTGIYFDTIVAIAGCDSIIKYDLTIEDGFQVNLSSSGDTLIANLSGDEITWFRCGVLNRKHVIPGVTDSFFIPDLSGSYAVSVKRGSCVDTSECTFVIVTGLATKNLSIDHQWYVSQDGKLILKSSSYLQGQLEIKDITGKTLLLKGLNGSQTYTIDISHLPTGVYLATVKEPKYKSIFLQFKFIWSSD